VSKGCFYRSINFSTYFFSSRLILFACFVVYALSGNVLNPDAVFVSMALFTTLRRCFTYMFPFGLSMASGLLVACRRVQQFLLLEEINPGEEESVNAKEMSENARLIVDKLSAKWNPDQQKQQQPTLKDISVDLKSGDLLAVIGAVGAGKVQLLLY
jgi:ABC-type transport system involved in cytochrome bd biosynthesis fused ATPase/permease subunit